MRAPIAQPAEAYGSNPYQCGFESHSGHTCALRTARRGTTAASEIEAKFKRNTVRLVCLGDRGGRGLRVSGLVVPHVPVLTDACAAPTQRGNPDGGLGHNCENVNNDRDLEEGETSGREGAPHVRASVLCATIG